ncbi:MAG TPA: carboxypeptidase-like regulatory domain-containing protein [Bryobacteraceae bacterium]|nr:carboxypeptidase-like regulatory domain-containing protein [Bryobacteraceae bacterium]
MRRAKHCPKDLAAMPGDEKKRFCADCSHYVYARSAYTDAEWAALFDGQRVCGSWWGATDAPTRTRRSVLAGSLLTTISPLLAETATLRLRIVDATGNAVPGATATATCANGTPKTRSAGTDGEAVFSGMAYGDCVIQVTQPGFRMVRQTLILTGQQDLLVRLEVGEITMGIVIPPTPKKRRWRWLGRG